MSFTITVPNTNFDNFVDVVSPITFDFSKETLANTSDTSLIDKLSLVRNSIATVCNKNGILETVAANVPRYNYDPVTKQFKGLLLEGESTNILKHSSSFNSWGFLGSSKSTVSTISPDGSSNCFKLLGSTQNSEHSMNFVTTSQVNQRLIFSVFLKKGDYDHIGLSITGFSIPMELVYKFSTKTVVSRTESSVPWYEVVDAPNGFVRVCFRGFALTATTNTGVKINLIDDNLNNIFIGDATKGTYVWGAQFETLSYSPSSYIPTADSTVTRAADECTASIPVLANKTIGIITEIEKPILQLVLNDAYAFIPIIALRRTGNISTYNKAICLDRASKSICAVTAASISPVVSNSGVSIMNGKIKSCALFSSTDQSISCNGSATATQNENTMPIDFTLLRLGTYTALFGSAVDYAGINIKNLRLFFVNLPKSNLQKLSRL